VHSKVAGYVLGVQGPESPIEAGDGFAEANVGDESGRMDPEFGIVEDCGGDEDRPHHGERSNEDVDEALHWVEVGLGDVCAVGQLEVGTGENAPEGLH